MQSNGEFKCLFLNFLFKINNVLLSYQYRLSNDPLRQWDSLKILFNVKNKDFSAYAFKYFKCLNSSEKLV